MCYMLQFLGFQAHSLEFNYREGNWYWSGKASGKMEMCCVGSTGNSVTDLSTKYSVPYCQKVSPCQRMKVDKSLIQKCVHVFTGRLTLHQ